MECPTYHCREYSSSSSSSAFYRPLWPIAGTTYSYRSSMSSAVSYQHSLLPKSSDLLLLCHFLSIVVVFCVSGSLCVWCPCLISLFDLHMCPTRLIHALFKVPTVLGYSEFLLYRIS